MTIIYLLPPPGKRKCATYRFQLVSLNVLLKLSNFNEINGRQSKCKWVPFRSFDIWLAVIASCVHMPCVRQLQNNLSYVVITANVFLINCMHLFRIHFSAFRYETPMRCEWRDADHHQGMFKDKSKYPTLTRMSYCQCRLKLVFASIFRQFGWKHVALLLDRSDLFSLTVGKFGWRLINVRNSYNFHPLIVYFYSLPISAEGKNLEYGLKQEGLLSFVRELNGNEEEPYDNYLRDASMYARGKGNSTVMVVFIYAMLCLMLRMIEIRSGHIVGARSFGAKIYASSACTRHDQRRLDVS